MSSPIDPVLLASHAIYTSPGTYALLIGSGVSTSAGIPTGWAITQRLIVQIAALENADVAEDAHGWYRERFGAEPDYSDLIETLGKSNVERHQIVKGFIEPSGDDREAGRKVPTSAHHSIATLASEGFVRVIVTTNFDRLIEAALEDAGVDFDVIDSVDKINGSRPIGRAPCTVVKLHGDYLDNRMRNTVDELDGYPPEFDDLLERVFEEHGLVIAGWSATWDNALRKALARRSTRRYSVWWAARSTLSREAQRLVSSLDATVIDGVNADVLFGRIADQVTALGAVERSHPASLPVAVATAKRELAGGNVAIGVHDTLATEFSRLHRIDDFNLPDYQDAARYGGYDTIKERVEEAARVPCGLVATLAYWGNERTDSWWIDELARFAVRPRAHGVSDLLDLKSVAGSGLFYAAGVASVAAGRFGVLAALAARSRPSPYTSGREPLTLALSAAAAFGGTRKLRSYLAPILQEAITVGDAAMDDAWQTFEVLRLATIVLADSGCASLLDTVVSLAPETDKRERGSALAPIATRVRNDQPHVLIVDRHADDVWHSPTADQLGEALRSLGDAHRLVTARFTSDPLRLAAAVDAVGLALGRVGARDAWRHADYRSGTTPAEVWLDSL